MILRALRSQPQRSGVSVRISLCNLCVLCVSVVVETRNTTTTETQRTQRLHGEEVQTKTLPEIALTAYCLGMIGRVNTELYSRS